MNEDEAEAIEVFSCGECGNYSLVLALDGRVICESCDAVLGSYKVGSLGVEVH